MIKFKWARYTWDTKKLPKKAPQPSLRVKLVEPEKVDYTQEFNTIESAYSLDPGWGVGLNVRLEEMQLLSTFSAHDKEKRVRHLHLMDGKRLVGVSLISKHPGFPRSLLSGICIIDEYRCRGAGGFLLYESLKKLEEEGLAEVTAMTKVGISADKFLYNKFDSKREEMVEDPEPLFTE